MKYEVSVAEVHYQSYSVEADSKEEAIEAVWDRVEKAVKHTPPALRDNILEETEETYEDHLDENEWYIREIEEFDD